VADAVGCFVIEVPVIQPGSCMRTLQAAFLEELDRGTTAQCSLCWINVCCRQLLPYLHPGHEPALVQGQVSAASPTVV
jgi:hypothetical protein